ncbi:MAG: TolC family protein, partial [Bryobacteraceae bacterium]
MNLRLSGLLILLTTIGFTQTAPRPLTLQEALSLADQNSPRLRFTSAAMEGSQAAITTARGRLNPVLTFGSMGYQRTIAPGTVGGLLHGATFTQPLEMPALRRTRIEVAEAGRRSSEIGMAETRLAIQAAVKHSFYEVLRRRDETELARGTLQLLEDLQRRIAVQVQVGEAARLALTRADAEVATA